MCSVLKSGLGALEFAAHAFELRGAIEVKSNISAHVVKQCSQGIVIGERRSRSGGLGIRLSAKTAGFFDQPHTSRAIVWQQRRAPKKEMVVKIVSVVAIEDVITGEQAFQGPSIAR